MRIVIVDSPEDCSYALSGESFDHLVFWKSYQEVVFPDVISIPALVEENAYSLRNRYLSLIYDLGESVVGESKLIDSLSLRSGFSYWWMTLIVEKCNFAKSPLINDVIRLFAFEEWVANVPKITSIKLFSSNQELQVCLEKWCEIQNICFESKRMPFKAESRIGLKRIFELLPYTMQAGVWLLKYLIDNWPLRGVGVEEWNTAKSQITFVSYFFNLQRNAAQTGHFESEYWTKLPYALSKEKIRSAWLHRYVKNSIAPTAKSAAKLIRIFNAKSNDQQVHVALESFLSIKTVIHAIKDYFRIRRVGNKDSFKVLQCGVKENQLMELAVWPLFKKDWERSFLGIDAIHNIVTLNLFEEAFANLPKQSIGVYLQENQGWEFGMIQAWRAYAHGELVGFPHSVVRFWDLRYFFDKRSYRKDEVALPMPDFVGVSGESVKNAYLEGEYRAEDLIEVEALRYLHLDKTDHRQLASQSFAGKPPKVLILGDYLASNISLQMKLLREIADDLLSIELTIKPHPACPIVVDDYPELNLKLSDQSLSDLLGNFDMVYTSSVTSAAVDAYSAGLQVISVLDPTTLNLSPLRGVAGVRFVSSAETLRDALLEVHLQSGDLHERVDYFNVDSSLPRWRALLVG